MVATHGSIMKGNVLLSALKANVSPDSAAAKEGLLSVPKGTNNDSALE